MMVSIEQHVDWISDCIADLTADGDTSIEPTEEAVAGWTRHVNDWADITLVARDNPPRGDNQEWAITTADLLKCQVGTAAEKPGR